MASIALREYMTSIGQQSAFQEPLFDLEDDLAALQKSETAVRVLQRLPDRCRSALTSLEEQFNRSSYSSSPFTFLESLTNDSAELKGSPQHALQQALTQPQLAKVLDKAPISDLVVALRAELWRAAEQLTTTVESYRNVLLAQIICQEFMQRSELPADLVSKAATLETQVVTANHYIERRSHVADALGKEASFLERLDQAPLPLQSELIHDGKSTQQLPDAVRDKFSSIAPRYQLFVDMVKSNSRVASSNIQIVGNCMLNSSREVNESNQTAACMASLVALREAQEVLAASARRETALARPMDTHPPDVPHHEARQPQLSSSVLQDERIQLFGPRSRALPNTKAMTLLNKFYLLFNAGVIVHVRAPAAGGEPFVRCHLNLVVEPPASTTPAAAAGDEWALEVTPADHQDQGGVNRLLYVSLSTIDMLTQGPVYQHGSTPIQAMRIERKSGLPEVEINFPSFASFTEWSEVVYLLVNNLPHLAYLSRLLDIYRSEKK